MCGISGIIRFNQPLNRNEIERMTSVLAHRGPDGYGIWLENNIALGHRRLSIIDLESGKQPMSNEDGTIWISYNGEIYNFLELHEHLIQKGHCFHTHSDTEVIIHAYEEWKEECVNYFRGMFAFGIVDKKDKRIFLARDHLGIKPLVYYADNGCFAFASEIQSLSKVECARLDLDMRGIDQYLWLQYIPAPRSVFKQIRKLPPAHCMSVTFDGKVSGPDEYWRLEFHPDYQKSEIEWKEELDAVLYDSVKAHLVSDVPFGAFLSGGIDSSSVVAYMAQIMHRPVKTFSIGFEEEEFNELKYAESVAKRWGTEHHFDIVKPDALGILPELVQHYGEPFGDSSAVPTYYVCKLAREYVPMVLSGDGGDEIFAGYNSYLAWMKYLHEKPFDGGPLWKKALYPFAERIFPERYPPRLKHLAELEDWLSFINYMPKNLRLSLWRKEYKSVARYPLDVFEKEYDRTRSFNNVNKVQYMDIKSYLPFDILTKVDIASMLNSLEVRTPFIDRKVVEFAATIPQSFNIRKGQNGEWQGKMLLKNLLVKYYPSDFLHRSKMGFAIPIQKWFSKKGVLGNEIKERLTDPHSMLAEYFRPDIIRHLVDNNYSGSVWLLLFLEEWLRQSKLKQ